MIGVTDIGNILYRDCKASGLEVYQKGNIPKGEIIRERITIYPKAQSPNIYWHENYVEVNWCTPDIDSGVANLIRLEELERQARALLGYSVGVYNGCCYRYKIESVGVEADEDMKCHYVNVTILFNVLNTD